jgi:SAM-dependent methyltransferase
MSAETPSTRIATTYDLLPYPPYTFPVTHISRLAAIGRLFGLATVDPSTARVLELGCGLGANLIGQAQVYPEAHFVGIDGSARQIEDGQSTLAATGLTNVELRCADIADLDTDLGNFDYIIAHGIFSWVPANVKEAIFRLSKEHLNPGGIAYISYNALPGWRMRGALRDMMTMHTAGMTDLTAKVAQAKALIKFLAESCTEDSAYGKYLRDELELLRIADDSYIAHEFLEETNEAMYFTDFLKEAAKHQLGYLGDAEVATMVTDNLPAQAAETLKSLNLNLLATEQYMDFVRNRMFRSSLLCHADAALERNMDPQRLTGMEVGALIAVKTPWLDGKPAVFAAPGGQELTVDNKIGASLFTVIASLGKSTRPVSEIIDEVVEKHRADIGDADPEAVRSDLGRLIIQGYLKKMLDLFVGSPGQPRAAASADHPETLPLARWQAGRGYRVSSPRLEMLSADPFVGKLITFCDGTRDRTAIIDAMTESLLNKEYQLNENNTPVTEKERGRFLIEQLYEPSVQNLRQLGLLLPSGNGNGEHA